MRYLVLVLSFLTSAYVMAAPPAVLVQKASPTTKKEGPAATQAAPGTPCVEATYADPKREPNYACRGPWEDLLVPDTQFRPSIGLPKGKAISLPALDYDAVLLDRSKVMELGLRIEAIRRLRWMDLHRSSDLLTIEQKYLRDTAAEKDKLAQSQVASYRGQLEQAQAELAKEKAWYRSWTFGLIVGVVLTAATAAGVAVAVRK